MNRQVTHVNLVPAIENEAGYFPFQGSITTDFRFKAWNVVSQWEPEFYGSPTDEALSGKKRSNFRGYRLKVAISLDNSTESSVIMDNLFNKLSAGFDRLVWQTTFAATVGGTQTFVINAPFPSAPDWLNSLMAVGFTSVATSGRVTDYVASTQTVTLASGGYDTLINNPVEFYARPNVDTVVLFDVTGTATTYNDSKLIACNVINNNYGATRESTINKQMIGIELESVQLFANIPQAYIVT
jgi:hypothetical protein